MTIEEFRAKKQNILNSNSANSNKDKMSIDEFRKKKQQILSGSAEKPKTQGSVAQQVLTPQTIQEETNDSQRIKQKMDSLWAEEKETTRTHVSSSQNSKTGLPWTLEARMENIMSKPLSEETIEHIKETSPILNPEKYHKETDAGYYGGKAVEGLYGAMEGILDTGAIAGKYTQAPIMKAAENVTSLGGALPNPVSNTFGDLSTYFGTTLPEKAMKENPAQLYSDELNFKYNKTNKAERFVGDVVSGVTGMIPTIGANLVAPGLGYGVLGAQAFGGGTQQAYQKAGELGAKEELYGLLSGLAEVGVEKLSGGIGGLGNGAVDEIASKMIRNGFIRNATGEGIEEAITTFIDPYLQRLTYDKEATGGVTDAETWKQAIRSALVGSLTSMVLQAPSSISDAATNIKSNINSNSNTRKLNDVDLTTQSQLQQISNNISQGETIDTKNKTPEEIKDEYEKLIPMQKNDVLESPQDGTNNVNNQIILENDKIAQNGNMEQSAQNDIVMDTLLGKKAENVKDVAKNEVLSYTDNRGDINGGQETRGTTNGNSSETGIVESKKENDFSYEKYRAEERRIREQPRIEYDESEKIFANNFKKKYRRDAFIFDDANTDFGGGVSVLDNNTVLFGRNALKDYGQNFLEGHEVFEIINKDYKDVANSDIKQWIDNIQEDNNFGDVFLNYISELKPNVRQYYIDKPHLIAKEIIGDLNGIAKSGIDISTTAYSKLEPNLVKEIQEKINSFEEQIFNTKADKQSAFSMPQNYIDPAQDIQKATEFVSKAKVEDIDTLNKMAEEAEKYPDRVDLQFFAKEARKVIEKLSRQQVRQAIIEETELENYNLDDITKLSKLKMNFTTPIRVVEKIFNKETANRINENFFKPIKHNEAEKIRRLNKERNDIKELNIKPGSAEDAAIQKYGEGEYINEAGETEIYTLDNLKKDFPETWQKLQQATNIIRNKYDTYLEEINEVLKDNGYDPIPKRKDYFRHFEELNDLFSVLGVPTKVDDIPTDLNGMTADLKPGKQFFTNALQRKGNKTTYSAIKGIDGYLDGAMNILYHTKDIQNLRTLDKYIRDTYGQSKGLENVETMTDEQKARRINQINKGHLSEFAAWLTEYTNALAGKKSRLDRGIEELFGRKAYKYLNLIKKQVGANMTGLNVNSALSNFISLTQAAPKTNKKALIKGTIDTVKNIFNKDDFIDKSDFLTTRFGSDKLAKNWWQKAGDAGQIFMSGTDYFTANLITRSKYQEFLGKGYTETEAIKKADEFADRLMAGRGKGDLPNAFESKMFGIVSQFQLEVANQLDSIFYDTLHEDYAAESNSKLAQEHPKFYNAASATFILGQMFALAFLYNEGKEELTGTEGGALDPIGTIRDAIKYLTDENLSKSEAIAMIVEDIANQLPFASIITGGGRIPIKEAIPNVLSMLKGETKSSDELWKLTNLLLPTGGGQIKKTTQGLSTYAQGGSYSEDSEGKTRLKYPVEQTPGNLMKSLLFGKWSTKEAKTYIDSGFKALTAKQTEGYEKARKQDITYDVFLKAYNAQKNIEGDKDSKGKTISLSASKNEKKVIDELLPGYTQKQKQTLYEAFGISEKVWEK